MCCSFALWGDVGRAFSSDFCVLTFEIEFTLLFRVTLFRGLRTGGRSFTTAEIDTFEFSYDPCGPSVKRL